MKDFKDRIPLDWHATLVRVLDRARAEKERGVIVFDLDSTLFDNRPRQARIVREFGRTKGLAPLETCQAHHFVSGWEVWPAFVACGLSEDEAKGLEKEFKKFWGARFFTSDYCVDDIEVVGAPRYVHACVATGARVAYVTGRQESMRDGTVRCLARCGLPLPEGRVVLTMKPTLEEDDDGFKRAVHASLGRVVAAFDNEPIHANDYARRFPEAIVVHLATDHSNRELSLDPRIVSIPHFAV